MRNLGGRGGRREGRQIKVGGGRRKEKYMHGGEQRGGKRCSVYILVIVESLLHFHN